MQVEAFFKISKLLLLQLELELQKTDLRVFGSERSDFILYYVLLGLHELSLCMNIESLILLNKKYQLFTSKITSLSNLFGLEKIADKLVTQ